MRRTTKTILFLRLALVQLLHFERGFNRKILLQPMIYFNDFLEGSHRVSGLASVPCNADWTCIIRDARTSFVSLRGSFKNIYKTCLYECSTEHGIGTIICG